MIIFIFKIRLLQLLIRKCIDNTNILIRFEIFISFIFILMSFSFSIRIKRKFSYDHGVKIIDLVNSFFADSLKKLDRLKVCVKRI